MRFPSSCSSVWLLNGTSSRDERAIFTSQRTGVHLEGRARVVVLSKNTYMAQWKWRPLISGYPGSPETSGCRFGHVRVCGNMAVAEDSRSTRRTLHWAFGLRTNLLSPNRYAKLNGCTAN